MKNQNVLGLVAIVAATLIGQKTLAFTDVCTLANTEVPASIRVAKLELASYKEKIKVECELSEKYQQMILKARKFGIALEQISEYQALRYIDRAYYESARVSNTPVPVIYQLLMTDYQKDHDHRSSVIWDGFQIGARQLEAERARIVAGAQLEIKDLQRIHQGFYTLSDEIGDFSHDPLPGILKSPSPNDRYWWRLKPEEVEWIRSIVGDINQIFATYGLVTPDVDGFFNDVFRSEIVSVREISNGEYGIYGGDSRVNLENLQHLLSMLNGAIAQARVGKHIIWNDKLVTPAEAALLAQQFFVGIHPFREGNGRTSRFIQELVLTLFSLPHGASGDLMANDILTRQPEYYTQAIVKTKALLDSVDGCLESGYGAGALSTRAGRNRSWKGQSANQVSELGNVASLNQMSFEYNCRILK